MLNGCKMKLRARLFNKCLKMKLRIAAQFLFLVPRQHDGDVERALVPHEPHAITAFFMENFGDLRIEPVEFVILNRVALRRPVEFAALRKHKALFACFVHERLNHIAFELLILRATGASGGAEGGSLGNVLSVQHGQSLLSFCSTPIIVDKVLFVKLNVCKLIRRASLFNIYLK